MRLPLLSVALLLLSSCSKTEVEAEAESKSTKEGVECHCGSEAHSRAGALLQGASSSGTYEVTLSVNGMSCVSCENHLTKTLSVLDGVTEVHKVDHVGKLVSVSLEQGKSVSIVEDAISAAGYKVLKPEEKE